MNENDEKRLINYRPLFEFALGMMAGISLCVELPKLALTVFAVLALVFGALMLLLKRKRIAVILLAALFGIALASAALPLGIAKGEYSLEGLVSGVELKDGKQTLILESVKLNGAAFNKRARLELTGGCAGYEFKIGDEVAAEASVRQPQLRFGTYDEYKSRLSQGVGLIASSSKASVVSSGKLPLKRLVNGIRESIEQRIDAAFGDDSGLFSALILGDRSELSDERAEAYRASGTAHLLAISGFHMGIIAGAVAALIPKRMRLLRLIIVGLAAAAYCTVAAYTAGIVRAAIMTVCLLGAGVLQRRPDTLSALSLAAIIILVFNPFQLYSVGFRFSFAAVFGIALFAVSLNRAFKRMKLPRRLSQAAAVCLAASAGTLMLQLRYYSYFTPYSVLANLIAVPAFSAVVTLGLIAALLAFVSPAAASAFAVLPRGILFAVEKLLGAVSKLPLASVEFAPPSAYACLIFLVLLFALSEYVLRPPRKRAEIWLPILILFTFSYFMGIINA